MYELALQVRSEFGRVIFYLFTYDSSNLFSLYIHLRTTTCTQNVVEIHAGGSEKKKCSYYLPPPPAPRSHKLTKHYNLITHPKSNKNKMSKDQREQCRDMADDNSSVSGVDYSEGRADAGRDNDIEARKKKQEAELEKITKSESKAVAWLRSVLAIVLIMSAVAVTVLVYKYSSSAENEEFKLQFESDSEKLFESIGINFDLTMGAADGFMTRVVSQARSTDAKWPFVTIPDLAVQTAKLIAQTDSIYMTFYPLITGDQRPEWERFTTNNSGWVEEALRVQSQNPNFHGPILEEYPISNEIWKNDGPEPADNPGPFAPSWMGSPVIPYYYPYK